MSLSEENINKLCMTGIYRCDPVLSWIASWRRDNPYHCTNWTFRVRKHDGSNKYYMYDTYWSTGDGLIVELTDENFDKFEYLFDLGDVRYVNTYTNWLEYPEEDRWMVPLDSGGISYTKFVVRRGANRVKEKVIERIQREIDDLKREIAYKERTLEDVINDEVDLRWV